MLRRAVVWQPMLQPARPTTEPLFTLRPCHTKPCEIVALLRPQDKDARWDFCKEMHKLKTDLFMEMIESGAMPLRPGVSRLISESSQQCTTRITSEAVFTSLQLRTEVRRVLSPSQTKPSTEE